MEDLIWNDVDAAIVISVGTAVICFSIYWFAAHAIKLHAYVDARMGTHHFSQYGAFYQKAIGVVLLGIIPAFIAVLFLPRSFTAYGVGSVDWRTSLYAILILGAILSLLPRFSARKEDMLRFYPQVRVAEWSGKLLIGNGLAWILYLTAYEFLFRGFLLMNVAASSGWWPAIAVTTAISSIAHIPKGFKETIGTIPLSVALCLIVVQTGGIWACIVIHSMLAVANDYWALTYNPKMQLLSAFKRRRPEHTQVD